MEQRRQLNDRLKWPQRHSGHPTEHNYSYDNGGFEYPNVSRRGERSSRPILYDRPWNPYKGQASASNSVALRSFPIHSKPIRKEPNIPNIRQLQSNQPIPPRINSSDLKDKDEEIPEFEDLDWKPGSPISNTIHFIQTQIQIFTTKQGFGLKLIALWLLFALYNTYLTAAIVHHVTYGLIIDWCDGIGFLIIVTGIVYWSIFYYCVLKKYAGQFLFNHILVPIGNVWDTCWTFRLFRAVFIFVLVGVLITFLILDTAGHRNRLISASGIPILIFCSLLISKYPARVVWRHVLWGISLQFIFGLAILKWEAGKSALECVSNKVERFLRFTNAGSTFVYGFLASGVKEEELSLPGVFAFAILPTIFYFSFVVGLLYHLGAITWVVVKLGWLLQVSIGTTAGESMNAAANIFLGQTEAPLLIKPFIKDMTVSELHAVMTGGFATIAGAGMGAFIRLGISASHLLSASCMSAPAALALAKLIYPETKISRTTSEQIYNSAKQRSKNANFLDAASEGATQAVFLIGNMIANLVAMIAFVSFLDSIISWFGIQVGFTDFSFQWILTKLFYPFALIIGIDTEELEDVSYLLGLKTVVNEFVAYQRLSTMKLSPRSKAITTYAICCFANFASIGVQLGGIGSMAPKRRPDMAKAIWRAFIAGNFAALMTACIAGTLMTEMGYQEWKALEMNSNLTSFSTVVQ